MKPKPLEKTLNTHADPQSQIVCPTSHKQPQNKHNEEKVEIENVPSVNWQSKYEVCDAVSHDTNVARGNPRASLADEDTQRAEERALPAEMQKEKMQA